MRKIISLCAVLLLFATISSYGQKNGVDLKKLSKVEKEKFETAEFFVNDVDPKYLRALPLYLELMNAHPEEEYFKIKAGICYLYKSDEKLRSIELFESVEKSNPKSPDIYFYLGRAYHLNYKFEESITAFNKYIATSPSINQRLLSEKYIENSKNAKVYVELKVKCEIKNIGPTINTESQEYVPVISSDEAVLIYTYTGPRSTGGLMDDLFNEDPKGSYYEDVFISQRVGEEWLTSQSIGPNINTKNHDASIALSSDGQKLFVFHSTDKDGGDIYMSVLEGEIWGVPKPLGPTVNSKEWEGSVSLSANGTTLYFASEREGGTGARDIYVCKQMPDGSWGKAENLGPVINTQYNEDSPFIHPDGITLFFSSEGHSSIGGYDIMYSVFKEGNWTEPVNLGYPINTPEDERFYVLTADGEHGYFSSDRKGGFGQQDLYTVT
ncbi:MAG: hypothetical protein M3R27_13145, partial [Bacteroidota bacterium]|nr:hypothetical protein [Bacteroidota bacterium]